VPESPPNCESRLSNFWGELSSGWPNIVRRFLAEMLCGFKARQSLRLIEISRASKEKVSLKKNVARLSRQLGRWCLWRRVTERLLWPGARRVFRIPDFRLYGSSGWNQAVPFQPNESPPTRFPPAQSSFRLGSSIRNLKYFGVTSVKFLDSTA
jgi:hypothetical protein